MYTCKDPAIGCCTNKHKYTARYIFRDMMYGTLHVSKFVTCILAPTSVGHVVLQTGLIWCRNPVVLSEFRPPCPRAINDLTHASAC